MPWGFETEVQWLPDLDEAISIGVCEVTFRVFEFTAATDISEGVAAIVEYRKTKLFGIQFHPEVVHTAGWPPSS